MTQGVGETEEKCDEDRKQGRGSGNRGEIKQPPLVVVVTLRKNKYCFCQLLFALWTFFNLAVTKNKKTVFVSVAMDFTTFCRYLSAVDVALQCKLLNKNTIDFYNVCLFMDIYF